MKCAYYMTALCIITVRLVYCEVLLSVELGGKNDFHMSKICGVTRSRYSTTGFTYGACGYPLPLAPSPWAP